MKLSTKPLQLIITYFVGSPIHYSLEARIFHVVTIIAVITAIMNMIVNFWIGLTIYGFIALPLIAILLYGYYSSRNLNKLKQAINLFAIAFNFICGATYFSSEGSLSVNLFTFILIIFLLSFLSSKKQFTIWLPLTFLHVITLFLAEYYYPDLAKPLYTSKQNRLFDVAQTWIEVAGMIAIITMYIQNNYNKEKNLAHSRLLSLEESNETKSKLFSIISHDLRAPLAHIEQYLTLMQSITLSDEDKRKVEQNLLTTTRQTSEMLQNILNWSKDQLTGITVQLSKVKLIETLKPTIDLAHTLAQDKSISLSNKIDPNLYALADVDMLQLIIRNLLNNAIKFSNAGGKIEISTIIEPQHCIIKVNDNGIGISDAEHGNIFSVSYKGNYGTSNEKGVGLGLMMAKNYIELQGGKIWFESKLGNGSTFFISLSK